MEATLAAIAGVELSLGVLYVLLVEASAPSLHNIAMACASTAIALCPWICEHPFLTIMLIVLAGKAEATPSILGVAK